MQISRPIHYLSALLLIWLTSVFSAHANPASASEPAKSDKDRVLFILGSSKVHGSSSIPASISFGEVVMAWDVFDKAGFAVDFVSPDGGAVPILKSYVSEDMEARLQDKRIMPGLRNTATPAQIDPTRYRAVYYVGGSNAMYGVAENPQLQKISTQVYERNNGVVSAVCHGTAGIVNLKLGNGQYLIQGKRVTGYPEAYEDQEEDYFKEFPFLIGQTVKARGGDFQVQQVDQSHVEVDGRLVTGQNYPSTTKVAEAVVHVLRNQASTLPSDARQAVQQAMQTFIRAFETSDPNIVSEVLRKDGVVLGYSTSQSKVVSQTSEEWAKGFQGKPAADEANRKRRFEILDVTETGAISKVVLNYPSWNGVDYIALTKIDGKWMIVSKTWSGLRGTEPAPTPSDEYKAVGSVVQNFIRAYQQADGRALMAETFDPDGRMIGYAARAAKMDVVAGVDFAGRFTGVADDENLRKRSFEILDITENAAVAKVTMDYPNWLGIDYLALAKINGQWKVISKSWSGKVKS